MPLANGSKGNPRRELDDGADFPADLTALSDWAADAIDRRVATLADRDAITTPWGGMQVYVSDTRTIYLYSVGVYYAVAGVTVEGNVTYPSNVSADSTVAYLEKDVRGFVTMAFAAVYTDNLADNSLMGTLQSGFRPTQNLLRPASSYSGGIGPCVVSIGTNGQIRTFGIAPLAAKGVTFEARFRAA